MDSGDRWRTGAAVRHRKDLPAKRGDGLGIVGAATGGDAGRYQQNCGCAPVGIEKEPLMDGADERGLLTQSSSDPKEIQRMTCTSEDAQ